MKRVLLTGGAGFVGANLARRLLREGHELHLLVKPGFQDWRLAEIGKDVTLYKVSLDDAPAVEKAVQTIRPEWIFHLAAYGAYPQQTDLDRIMAVNFTGTLHLIEAAVKQGFEVFINTGSSSEYGYKDHAPSETEWLEPNSPYAVSKAAATQFCRFTAQKKNVNIQTLRLYSIYGPYEEPTRLIPTIIRRGLKTKDLPPLVNPKIARDFVYIEDTVDAYLAAAGAKFAEVGAIYNIGTGRQTTMAEVVKTAKKVLAIKSEPAWNSMPERQWDTSTWIADSRKVREHLGWKPKFTFEQGFKATVEWYRQYSL